MRRIVAAVCIVTLVAVMPTGSVPAQDFGQLLEAVDKIETTLKAMVDKESETRAKEVAKLRELVQQNPAAAGPGEQARFTQLVLEVKALRGDVDRLSGAQVNAGMTESDLLTLINDIEYLKSEMNLLRTTSGENKKLLASIDNEGFYVPPQNDPRIESLTEKLTALNASLEEVINRESGTAASNPSVGHGKISLSAFVHEQYVSGPDETSTFVSKRARLAVKGDINEYARIKIQAEFAGSPKLLDGQLTISPHEQWSLSAGQYKPPFGTEFLISGTSAPFVNGSRAKGLGTNRDIGASVSYRNKFSPDYSLKLTAGLFNGSGINTSDVNNTKNFVARAEVTLGGMFTVAPNAYIGKTNEVDSLKEDISDFGSSVTWKWQKEIVEAEYLQSKHGETKRNGWYLWGGHTFSIGSSFLQELQLLARYEQYDPDLDIEDDRTDRITLGTALFIDKKYTKIQMNYQINGEQGTSVDDNEFLMNLQVAF